VTITFSNIHNIDHEDTLYFDIGLKINGYSSLTGTDIPLYTQPNEIKSIVVSREETKINAVTNIIIEIELNNWTTVEGIFFSKF
jgi:hypothetical protein